MGRLLAAVFAVLSPLPVPSQPRVEPRNMYERIQAIVPMVGAGTWEDPKRPMLAPKPSEMTPGNRSGIIAFHHQTSDDGKFALVKFVFADRAALKPVLDQAEGLARSTVGVRVFLKGLNSRAEVEEAFRGVKRGFDLDRFEVRVP